MDPWAMALDVLFTGPGSEEAVYTAAGGEPVTIRIIRSRPDQDAPFGQGRVIQATNLFEIKRADIAAPAIGDLVTLGSDSFEIVSEPMLDVEGLTWTVGASRLP